MEKLKVILIDDEMLIRKLIRMKMNTDRLNLEIIGEYSNGADAFADIQNVRPDIVISDICMPEEDGLSFSEKCVQILPEVKIILVTGYDDFEYARGSIKVGIFDYLLKPVQADELNSALERATEEIRKLREQKEKHNQFRDEIEKHKTAFRDIYINKILAEDDIGEDVEAKLLEYGVTIDRTGCDKVRIAVLVVQEGFYEVALIAQVLDEASAFFESDEGVVVLKDLWNRIVIISDNAEIPFVECIDILKLLIRTKLGCHLLAGVSEPFEGWGMLRAAYLDALAFIREKRQEEKIEGAKALPGWEELKEAVQNGSMEKVQEIVKGCIPDEEDLYELRRKIHMSCQKLCIDLEINQCGLVFDKELSWCYTAEHLKYCLGNIAVEIAVRKKIERGDSNGMTIQKILLFMLSQIDREELSLNYLSTEFSVSNSHLSKMLKSFTGKKYVEIQSDMRLLKMLELIHTTNLKDYNIGRQIGIQDAHYLSIWFKKMMGYSITEYRKLIETKSK